MTSPRQLEANRRNALKSTGPATESGKRRSRRNAVRHGLTAETVISLLENPEDYKAFELSITSGFDVETAVERELVLRLASLLWRLRRAIAIESGLLQLPSETADTRGDAESSPAQVWPAQRGNPTTAHCDSFENEGEDKSVVQMADFQNDEYNDQLAYNFLRLAKVDHGAFKRLGRYETALWRQVGQILSTIDVLQWKTLRGRSWSSRQWRKLTKSGPSERSCE